MSQAGGSFWTRRSYALQLELYAVYHTAQDPRVPWFAKAVAAGAVGYQFSPIQLIPDWVPVLGFAHDLLALALAAALVRMVTPETVLGECRQRAETAMTSHAQAQHGVAARLMLMGVLVVWLCATVMASILIARLLLAIR